MAENNYRLVRGMKDVVAEQADKFDFIIKTATELAECYNFQHLPTPIVEYTTLFERNLGNESDIMHKELYRFEDRGGDMLALRPEMTAGVCRFVIENGLFQGNLPCKFFSYGPVFRYDRPQKGRYRQFNQLNFEIFGMKDMAPEISIYLRFIVKLLSNIGINDIKVKINYLGSNEERLAYTSTLKKYLLQYEDQLSADSKRRLNTNILRILDSKEECDKKILANAPKIFEFLSKEHQQFLKSFISSTGNNEVNYEIDYNLVRGLDYYSGLVFEITTNKIGETQDAVCGGREYNNLIFDMCGKRLSAFGFALGIERLMLLMNENNMPKSKPLYCFLTNKYHFIENAKNDINLSFVDNLSKGLKWANQIGADFVIFEKDGKLCQRNMKSGEQILL